MRGIIVLMLAGMAWPIVVLAQGEAAAIELAEVPGFGPYLTDAQGRALYMFSADPKETGGSACTGACARAWPPLISNGQPQLGEGLDDDKVGTIHRSDGGVQVTYGGQPLYYFSQDLGPGQVSGQDRQGFGGEWHVIAPTGEPIRNAAR